MRIERIWAIGPEALIWTDREPRCGFGLVMVDWFGVISTSRDREGVVFGDIRFGKPPPHGRGSLGKGLNLSTSMIGIGFGGFRGSGLHSASGIVYDGG